ncbi:MAG TPA: hypothetical protein VHF50_04455 [Solirubrobacterales bacterium]|nr:hypothetical protein [Solirubrobacterales bacterium]
MRGLARPLGLAALAAALLVLVLGASPAKAAFGIAEWEALTCKENVDTPALGGAPVAGPPPLPQSPGQCTKDTPEKWYTQAAGHPPFGITDFTLNTFTVPGAIGFPEGFVKEIVVDTPEGLNVNPEATPVKCTVAQLSAIPPACPPASLVGVNYLTVAAEGPPCPNPPIPGTCNQARAALPVYNLVPFEGVPSMVGFPTNAPGDPTIIVGDLDPKDQHVRFTINDIHAPDGTPAHPPIVGSRLVFNGKSTPGFTETYLTMPSNCAGGQTSVLHVKSHEGAEDTESFTTAVGASGCENVPFNPGIDATASGATDSPEPATVDVQMPDQLKPLEPVGNSHLLTAKVILPEGAGLNPSLANGLETCTDAQFKKGTDEPVQCPAASRIGSVEVDTRALDQDLGGDVYVAQPLSNDPTSGNQFRVFIHAFNNRYGVNVRLIGHVFPNLQTGQLTVVVPDNPQAPFNSFKVHVEGGPHGALTSPPTCGPHPVAGLFTPWSRPNEEVPRQDAFTLTTAPGGGPCAKTLAERPFDPGYSAGPTKTKAGEFTPFELHLTRGDGQQELRQVNVTLPPGMVAQLRNLDYCPEQRIDDLERFAGSREVSAPPPPCPDKSFLGTSRIAAGSGDPFVTNGNVYLAGPYKGAPLSLVFVTPANAGPFDLGNVVVRVAHRVDPETVQVTAVSDAIPYVFGGVKLGIRKIDVSIHRKPFTLNPTSCKASAIAAEIAGGGGNPNDPAAWSKVQRSSKFRATKCGALKFRPRFSARIFGGSKQARRAANPKFRVILSGHYGDANVKRASFITPRALILDQSHIRTICTRVQLAADNCPKGSIYGFARARSPLLSEVVKGPVYLTSSKNQLPDLLADLEGQIDVQLRGVISSVNGRLKTVFRRVPDVPVRKFVLTMKGGDRGLLVNSENLCAKPRFAKLNLKAHNGKKKINNRLRLRLNPCR